MNARFSLNHLLLASAGRVVAKVSCRLAVVLAICPGWAPAIAQESPLPRSVSTDAMMITSTNSSVEMVEKGTQILEFREWLTRVDGFDPNVISVMALEKNKLRVQGLSQGVTTLVCTDRNNVAHSIEVLVSGDTRLLKSVLSKAFPNSNIQVTMVKQAVLLRGWVTDNQQIANIVELAEQYGDRVINQMRVGGPQEVQLRVKVIEVQRSKLRRFGFDFAVFGRNAAIASVPGGIAPLTALAAPIGGTPTATLTPTLLNPTTLGVGFTSNNMAFEGFIQALKDEGLLKIQAEPVLVTRSGEAARLANGGQFPVPVPQSLGQITLEWREFGVILEALPIVISPTRLKQSVRAEVSERDEAHGVTIAGTSVPALTNREVKSVVEMNFGQTQVIGGLISTRMVGQTQKTPFLGELPGIGTAFSRKRHENSEVELIVMITPEYVSPLNSDQASLGGPGKGTEIPTDRELFKQGLLEVPAQNFGCQNHECDPDFRIQTRVVPITPNSTRSHMIPPGPVDGSLPPAGVNSTGPSGFESGLPVPGDPASGPGTLGPSTRSGVRGSGGGTNLSRESILRENPSMSEKSSQSNVKTAGRRTDGQVLPASGELPDRSTKSRNGIKF